jgi:hypothetical protein
VPYGEKVQAESSLQIHGTSVVKKRSICTEELRSGTMRTLVLALAAGMLSTAAFAQDTTTTIKKEQGILGSETTIEQRKTEPSTSSSTTVETTGGIGCTSETRQKTDAFGDTTTKKTTEC